MQLSKTFALTAVISLTMSGCMASRYQISDALMRYGLDRGESNCAAEFLRGHLSTGQVRRLADAAQYYDTGRRLTFGDLIRVAGRVDDAEVLAQVGASALACKIGGDIPLPRF